MPTFTKKRGIRRWLGQVKRNGKIIATKQFGAGKKEQRKAILWEEKTKAEHDKTQTELKIRTASLTIHEWGVGYLNEAKRRFVEKTYKEKREVFRRLMKYHSPNSRVNELTPQSALAYLQDQYDNRSGYAANKDRKNLATAWKWGRKYLTDFPEKSNPFRAVETFPEVRQERYVPPEADFRAVHALTDGQDHVMLTAFLHLAARRGEIFRLKWSDVDFPGDRIRVSTRKTKDGSWRYDWLPMTPELRQELVWWRGNRPYPSAEHVFVMLDDSPSPMHTPGEPYKYRQHFMRQMCKRAGVKRFGFHAIRHLSATILYKAGHKLSMIQRILRHTQPSTTEGYLKSLGFQLGDVREAMEAFSNNGPAKVTPFAKKKASGADASQA